MDVNFPKSGLLASPAHVQLFVEFAGQLGVEFDRAQSVGDSRIRVPSFGDVRAELALSFHGEHRRCCCRALQFRHALANLVIS